MVVVTPASSVNVAWSLPPSVFPLQLSGSLARLRGETAMGSRPLLWKGRGVGATFPREEGRSRAAWTTITRMTDVRSATDGERDEQRRERRRMGRERVDERRSTRGGREEQGWFKFPSLVPYIDEEGYLVDPREIKASTKILFAALGIAIVLAIMNPPPWLPRSYLHQVWHHKTKYLTVVKKNRVKL